MIKKRVITAGVFSILAIFLLQNYWLVKKPIDVGFNIKGENLQSVEVKLNNENSNEFIKFKSQTKKVNKNKKYLSYSFKKPIFPKRIQIVLNLKTLSGGGVKLSPVSFRLGSYKLKDFENFTSDDAKLSYDKNNLIITPKNKKVVINYNKPLKLRAAMKFDILNFIVILVLSILLSCKLSNYLADFKSVKNCSRLDIVFLLIFFILLFIPMSHIKKDNVSKAENRKLAVYKPFIKDGKINYNFGKDFDKWFNDRFNLRGEVIKAYNFVKYTSAINYYETPRAFINKKTNWCFRLDKYAQEVLKNGIKKEQIILAAENLSKYNDFCNKNNIKLYILITPSKEFLYKGNTYPILIKDKDNYKGFVDYIKENTDIKIVYPFDEIQKRAKNEFMFFKTDHHWTDYAAWFGYLELAEEIKKDFHSYKPMSLDEFRLVKNKYVYVINTLDKKYLGQTLLSDLGLKDKKVLDEDYIYLEHKDDKNLETTIKKIRTTRIYNYKNSSNNLSVFLIGNSMTENLSHFLPYNFKRMYKRRINDGHVKYEDEMKMKRYEKEILDFKPDILILNFDARYFKPILNMYPKEEK